MGFEVPPFEAGNLQLMSVSPRDSPSWIGLNEMTAKTAIKHSSEASAGQQPDQTYLL